MPGHRRGRSLSEGLMLEESEKGGLVVSSVIGGSSGNQGLKEGDEIVGATINFDQLSKDDVLKILKLMDDNGFDEKVQVLTKNNLSKSMGTLDSIKAPEEMLKDSYNRLYNAKINRFMKDDSPGQPAGAGERGSHNGQVKGKGPRPLWGKPKVKGDLKPPVPTMDYPVVETHKVDAPTYLESPDLKFSAPKLKVPKLDVKGAVPDARGGELSLPNANISTSDLSLPHLNGSLNIDAPSVNLERPYLETDIDAIDAPEFDMSLPKDDLKGPDLDLKVIDPLPKVRGDINVPEAELNLPEGVVTGPTLNINAPKLDIERTGKMFKMPKFKMPDLGLSGPSVNVPSLEVGTPNMRIPDKDMPGVNLKGPQLDLQAPDVNLKGPNLDLQAPDVSMMNMPSSKIRVRSSKKLKNPNLDVDDPSGYFELPKVRLSRRVQKGPDLDIDSVLKTQDMHLKTSLIGAPDLNVPDLDLPSVDIKGSKIDLELPDANIGIPSGKIKTPSLDMPDFDISGPRVRTPDLDLSADEMCLSDVCLPDLSTPDIGITSGQFKLRKPHAELKAPDFNVDAPSGKLKMPKFGFSGLKRPDLGIDADVKTPTLSLKAPKIKGGLDAPDLDLPKVDLKSPKMDANTPDIDIDAPSGKFKVPTFKMPKCTLSGPRGPEVGIDGELDGPDLSLSSSKLKQPDVDVGSPSGKFKMPIFKMPDFGFSGPDVQGPDFEVKNPNLDLSGPKFKGGISHPDLDLPDVDLKGPKIDLNAPDVNFNMPSGKVKVPTLKKPKVDLNAPDLGIDGPSGHLKMPKFGLSGKMPKSPKLNLKASKMKGGIDFPDINLPDADLKAAKLDMTAPDLDINAPSGKFKMPKFRGLKVPNVDINGAIEGPDLNLSSPKLKGPKADLNIPDADIDSPSGKFKMPTFKMPDLGLSGPKVKGPDLDLSAPKFKGRISHPDLDLPDVDLKGPKLDLKAPDVNFNMPSGKVKVPTLKKPKVDLNAPDLDIDGPSGHLKMPKFGLSGKMPKSTKLNLKAPKLKGGIDSPDMNLPDADLKAPKLDVNSPDLYINAPSGKFKMPKFKMPKFRGLKRPDVDIDGDLDGPEKDINAPTANLKGPKTGLKMPDLKMPDFGLSGPNVDAPDYDLPDIDLSAPKLKGGISPPDLRLPKDHLRGPKVDLNAPDMSSGRFRVPTIERQNGSIKTPGFDISTPTFKMPEMPKFMLSRPKRPDQDISADIGLKLSKMKGGIGSPDLDLPTVDLEAPKIDVDTPDMNIDSPSGNFKMPHLKIPKFSLSGLNGPDAGIDGDIDGPDLSLSAPKVNTGIGSPDLDINVPSGNLNGPQADLNLPDSDIAIQSRKFKLQSFKLPQFGSPNLRAGTDMDFMKTHDISPPKAKVDLKAPDLKVSHPDVSLSLPKADIRGPKYKVSSHSKRRSDIPGGAHLKLQARDIDTEETLPHTDRKSRKVKGRASYPIADIDLPKVEYKASGLELRGSDLNDPTGKLKIPKSKIKLGSHTRIPDLDVDSSLASINASVPKLPQPGFGVEVSQPDLNLSRTDLRGNKHHRKAPAGETGRTKRRSPKQSEIVMSMPNCTHGSNPKMSEDQEGYFVTAFPKHVKGDVPDGTGSLKNRHKEESNRRSQTLRSLDFSASNVDLEVPEDENLKGSTFWLSKLI